jgi:hypothetical protein
MHVLALTLSTRGAFTRCRDDRRRLLRRLLCSSLSLSGCEPLLLELLEVVLLARLVLRTFSSRCCSSPAPVGPSSVALESSCGLLASSSPLSSSSSLLLEGRPSFSDSCIDGGISSPSLSEACIMAFDILMLVWSKQDSRQTCCRGLLPYLYQLSYLTRPRRLQR